MSRPNLPSILMTAPSPVVSSMHIETSVLDPIIATPTFARFVLEKKGILDQNSVITLSIHPDAAGGAGGAFLPLRTGAHAAIKQAVLKVGTKVLATSQDYAYLQTVRRQFKTMEEKSGKDMVKVGTIDAMCPDSAGDGRYQVRDVVYDAAGTAATVPPQFKLKTSTVDTPVWTVKLSELFGFMRNVQLPLFLMSEPVSVELTFHQQSAADGTLCLFSGAGVACSVGSANLKFIADYLTYTQEQMNQTAKLTMSETGLSIPYEDQVLTTAQYPAAVAAGSVRQTRDIGLAGRRVRNLVIHERPAALNGLLGAYSAAAPHKPSAVNFRVNDSPIYARPITSESRHQHQLSQVFSTDLNVCQAEYSYNGQVKADDDSYAIDNSGIVTSTLEGKSQEALRAQQHFLGVDLTTTPMNVPGAGTLIGQAPIRFEETCNYVAGDLAARTVRMFATVERDFMLRNGQVSVSA